MVPEDSVPSRVHYLPNEDIGVTGGWVEKKIETVRNSSGSKSNPVIDNVEIIRSTHLYM